MHYLEGYSPLSHISVYTVLLTEMSWKNFHIPFTNFLKCQVVVSAPVWKAPCTHVSHMNQYLLVEHNPIFFQQRQYLPVCTGHIQLNPRSWIICCGNNLFNECKGNPKIFCAFTHLKKWPSKYLEHSYFLLSL